MNESLDEWIRDKLTVDIESELSKQKEKVRSVLRLTSTGGIVITNSSLTAKQKIVTYMIGKVYSFFAKYSHESSVTNKELIDSLRLPEGTIKFNLHELRKDGDIVSKEEGVHEIRVEKLGAILDKYVNAGATHE